MRLGIYLLLWLPMVVLAILNGTAREFTYGKAMSEAHAHQLSTFTLILAFVVYVWLVTSRWPLRSAGEAVVVGLIWLALTIAFEFGMGRFISHQSWDELLAAYDIFSGNLWLLVPLAVAVLPVIATLIRKPA